MGREGHDQVCCQLAQGGDFSKESVWRCVSELAIEECLEISQTEAFQEVTAKNEESLPCLGRSNTVTVVSVKVIKTSCVTVIKQLCNSKSCKTINSVLQQLGMWCVRGREGEAG